MKLKKVVIFSFKVPQNEYEKLTCERNSDVYHTDEVTPAVLVVLADKEVANQSCYCQDDVREDLIVVHSGSGYNVNLSLHPGFGYNVNLSLYFDNLLCLVRGEC